MADRLVRLAAHARLGRGMEGRSDCWDYCRARAHPPSACARACEYPVAMVDTFELVFPPSVSTYARPPHIVVHRRERAWAGACLAARIRPAAGCPCRGMRRVLVCAEGTAEKDFFSNCCGRVGTHSCKPSPHSLRADDERPVSGAAARAPPATCAIAV